MWLWALPLILGAFGVTGVWTVYALAQINGSLNITNDRFPYISEFGSYPPQSTVFSQYCNICSFLGLWIVIIRFQQVKDYGDHGIANTLSMVLGFISCAGVSVVGNFQQSIERAVHLFGVFTAFVLGVAYFWLQLFLTYRAQPSHDRSRVGPLRAMCCSVCTILIIAMVVLAITGHHSTAAMCEWALVQSFFILFALFAFEFRHIDCHHLTVQRQALKAHPNAVVANNNLTPVAVF